MKEVKLSTKERVRRLFHDFREDGLMTHVYGAWGSLNPRSKVHKVEILPDGRKIFDLASLTKAVSTTPLVVADHLEKKIELSSTLGEWATGSLPMRLDDRYKNLEISKILGHQAGLPAWGNFWINRFNVDGQMIDSPDFPAIAHCEHHLSVLNRISRTHWVDRQIFKECYSDVGFILLGLVLNVVKKKSLRVLFRDLLQNNLKDPRLNQELFYAPSTYQKSECVPTGFCLLRKRLLVGEVHDENCAALGGESGHAGLFGTGDGMVRFLVKFFNSQLGSFIIRENFRRAAQRLQKNESILEPMLGWRVEDSSFFLNNLAVGHLGFTGVGFWILPEKAAFAVLLTNRVISGRISSKIKVFRKQFFNTVESEL